MPHINKSKHWRAHLICLGCTVGLLLFSPPTPGRSNFGSDVVVGAVVELRDRIPINQIDHAPFDRLLRKYVGDDGRVAYQAWQSNREDSAALHDYFTSLSRSNGRGNRSQQLAFWINAYNALTIHGILREYPTSSIRNHVAKIAGYNIWKDLKLRIGGTAVALDDMEHKILRKLDEPRIHFAIVCASIGCPRLLNEAYEPTRLEDQLDRNARSFFADPSKFGYDASRGVFQVSSILDWFGEDFGDSKPKILMRIAPWLPEGSSQTSAAAGRGKLEFLDYNWDLNDAASRGR